MIACQTANSLRGIGRYTQQLVRALLAQDTTTEYVLYYRAGLTPPTALWPASPPAGYCETADRQPPRSVLPAPGGGCATNPEALDLLLVTSPFETLLFHEPLLAKPVCGLRLAAVVYDLIKLLFPDRYLPPRDANTNLYHESLFHLRQFDVLLAISHATKADCERLLGIPSGASSPSGRRATRSSSCRPA